MKVHFREQVIPKMLHFGKENKIFKYPVLAFVTGYFACHHAVQFILKERYRYFALTSVVLIFLFSSSFTDPVQTEIFASETVSVEESTEEVLRLSKLPDREVQEEEILNTSPVTNDQVLIFDESTSGLDAITEKKLIDNLMKLIFLNI